MNVQDKLEKVKRTRDRRSERKTEGEYWRQSGLKSGQIAPVQTSECVCILLNKYSKSQAKHSQWPRPFDVTDSKSGHASRW